MAKILIVEDYPAQEFVYSKTLERAGYTVESCDSGDKALEMVKGQQYDLILLDVLLKEMSGLDFLRKFKPANHPGTKVVIFSNINNPDVVNEALKLGATSYFTKSHYTPDEVLEAIDGVLKSKTDAAEAGS